MYGRARSLVHREKQHRRLRYFHLLVITCALQRFTASEQSGVQLVGTFNRRPINGLGHAMEFRVRGIEDNHTPLPEQARIKAGEGRAHGFAGTVRLAHKIRRLGIAQQRRSFLHHRQNLFPQPHLADWRSGNVVAGSRERSQQAIGAGKRHVIHFGEIVVIAGQPEHRNRVDARGRRLFRQFHRSERLVDGKRRSAEQADLLSCHDGSRAPAQAIEIGKGLWRSIPGLVLALENRADPHPARSIVIQPACLGLRPLTEVRRMRVKRMNVRSVCQEVAKQPSSVRDLSKRKTLRLHRGHL